MVGEKKTLKVVPLPRIPENAFLVSVFPPTWLQFGDGIYVVTNGFLWLNEKMTETNTEDYEWFREGNEWFIRISTGLPFSGIYRAENGRLIELTEQAQSQAVFLSGEKIIHYDQESLGYVELYNGNEFFVEKKELEIVRVEALGKTFFVPRYYLGGGDEKCW